MRAFSEEILCIIFSFFFEIYGSVFFDVIYQLFSNEVNDVVTDVLCVCKQWHRIGLVYLYRTIIIRSKAQALALAATLDDNEHLVPLIKNIRVEGAYPRLDDIFKRCSKLDHLNVLMWDILPMEDMGALCRAFHVVDPVAFHFLDVSPDSDDFVTAQRGAKFDMVHAELCSAIPKWPRLFKFQCYWFRFYEVGHPVWSTRFLEHRIHLASALSKSPTLRIVDACVPPTWTSDWETLINVPTLCFVLRFHCSFSNSELVKAEDHFRRFNRWDERIAIKFIDTKWMRVSLKAPSEYGLLEDPSTSQFAPIPHAPKPAAVPPDDDKTPHEFIRPNTRYSHIWRRILLLVLFDTANCDTIIDLLFSLSSFLDTHKVRNLMEKRNSIRAVSPMWEAILDNALAAHPLIFSVEEMFTLEKFCARLGHKILFLSLNFLPHPDNNCLPCSASLLRPTIEIPSIDEPLAALLPYLSNLTHFISTQFSSFSTSTFHKLAVNTGRTLKTVVNVYITPSTLRDDRIPTTDVDLFKNLNALRFIVPPRWDVRRLDGTETFPALEYLAIDTMRTCDAFYIRVSYPALRKVRLCEVTIREEAFLKVVGGQIRELEVVLTDPTAPTNGSYDLLGCCPKLETLYLGTRDDHLGVTHQDLGFKFFHNCRGHDSLGRLSINVELPQSLLPCEVNQLGDQSPFFTVKSFFQVFNPFKFLNMREIRFDGYSWPIGYRHMKDNIMIDVAVLYAQWDIVVLDRWGKPFRRRLQHKEGVLAERSKMYRFMEGLKEFSKPYIG